MTVPALVSWFYNDPDMQSFGITALICMFIGILLVLVNRTDDISLTHKDGVLLTSIVWVTLSLVGSVPLYYSGVAGSWTNAIFESVSGLTTTGATVFSGLDNMGHGVLLWRAMLQWLGGMGILVLAVAVLPFLGIGGLQLYRSEMPGVTKDKLKPRLHATARFLWFVYLTLSVMCALAYWFAGMTPFDAITHAFTTLSTGGFANYDASFGYFNSRNIEVVSIFFMLMGAINFSQHFAFLTGKGPRVYLRSPELQLLLVIIVGATAIITMSRIMNGEGDYSFFMYAWEALFHIVSIVSSTGFVTVDFSLWPYLSTMFLMVLMFVGGCSGSTAGGMKVLRIIMVIKQGQKEILRLLHPNAVLHVKLGETIVADKIIQSVWAFVGIYVIVFIIVSIVMSAYGLGMEEAFSAAAANLNNTGPGLGSVGPLDGYAHLPDGAKLTLCAAMLLGRLELFTILILLVPSFWRK